MDRTEFRNSILDFVQENFEKTVVFGEDNLMVIPSQVWEEALSYALVEPVISVGELMDSGIEEVVVISENTGIVYVVTVGFTYTIGPWENVTKHGFGDRKIWKRTVFSKYTHL